LKDKVITLRMNEKSFESIKDYAENHGLSVNAYLNSIVDSYAEWFIPTSSYKAVTVPKGMLSMIFGMLEKDQLDHLAKQWAMESKNIVLLSGAELSIGSAVDFSRRVSKYFMGADAKITKQSSQVAQSHDGSIVSIAIRHDAGENFSFFCSQSFLHFFNLFGPKKVSVTHDPTTIVIQIFE